MTSNVANLRAVVAVPARNEQARLGACLTALVAQVGQPPGSFGIVVFLNNCTDASEAVVAAVACETQVRIKVIVRQAEQANAGWARREAMETAAQWLEDEDAPDGIILTTDADSRVGPAWIADNLACIADGADAVAGRFVFDDDDATHLPLGFRARLVLEHRYEALLTEICARLDPETGNGWPCHRTRSGATLAVRRIMYERVGGMPALALGEDHAFIEALRAHDAIVRHAPDILVVTSARTQGRAIGGAADTIRRRCEEVDALCDRRLEALPRAMMRVLWRRRLRVLHATGQLKELGFWVAALRMGRDDALKAAAEIRFGAAFAGIEDSSPALTWKPLRPSALPMQIRLARLVLIYLRARDRIAPAGHQADSPSFAIGEGSAQSLPIA